MDKLTKCLVDAANTEFEVGHRELPSEVYRTFERSGLHEDIDQHSSRLITIMLERVRDTERLTNQVATRIYIAIMNQSVSCEAFYKEKS